VPWSVRVVHEDADLAVVDKPAGLPTLPDALHLESTLLTWLRERYGEIATPAHRLDRGTSGLVLVARHAAAARTLGRAFARGEIVRGYLARVVGTALPDGLTIDRPIGRVPYAPTRWLHAATPDGAPSRTHVQVLRRDRARGVSLVEIEIETGRPHQVRIHLACAGAPLVGDRLYGLDGLPRPVGPGECPPLPGDGGYALRAHRLALVHPGSARRMTFRTCGEAARTV
jgi:23S rRNA pseudouridine1911/1915/1917 synthase